MIFRAKVKCPPSSKWKSHKTSSECENFSKRPPRVRISRKRPPLFENIFLTVKPNPQMKIWKVRLYPPSGKMLDCGKLCFKLPPKNSVSVYVEMFVLVGNDVLWLNFGITSDKYQADDVFPWNVLRSSWKDTKRPPTLKRRETTSA